MTDGKTMHPETGSLHTKHGTANDPFYQLF
jgi:hypothetical protein